MEWSKRFVSLTEKEQVKLKLKAVKRRKQTTCNSTNPKPLEARGKQGRSTTDSRGTWLSVSLVLDF